MKVAVTGCCHGELDETYKQIRDLEAKNNYKVDLVMINGDFEAVRNHQDLVCMAGPWRYRHLGSFYKYYTGEVTAPALTIVVGGNHEASNYMWELYHGGWLAPNIYYLGGSGCVKVNGLRVAGASGIYKEYNYRLGHHERMPYDQSDLRSAYHLRLYDVAKLGQLSSPDVFMSHDWPVNITQYGDVAELLKHQPRFKPDIDKGQLGSPPMMDLLRSLRPSYWFSAHMHCKFEALVNHGPETSGASSKEVGHAYPRPPATSTRFLALDKCVPKRPYLHVLDVNPTTTGSGQGTDPLVLTYDREWLAISRALHPYLSIERHQPTLPSVGDMVPLVQESLRWVDENIGEKEIQHVQKFTMTAPGPVNTNQRPVGRLESPPWYTNPQTEAFCAMLGVENKVNPPSV